jgi:hypothetical protein
MSSTRMKRLFSLTCLLLLGLAAIAEAAELKPNPDFSNYDVPLQEQITNHIKDKVMARLGEGRNTHDRYFIIPFAYENDGNDPEYSHSFLSVIRVLADDQQPKLTSGLRRRTYKNRAFEAESQLCVFEGVGARLVPSMNKCPVSIGRNFTLAETIRLGVHVRNAMCMWGPYEITKPAFDLGVKRMRLLNAGTIKYRADDRLTRKEGTAINCFHAMAGLDELYPNGGIFGTGFKMWGLNGTARVLIEYTHKAGNKGFLLEPVDEKKERFGFVYVPKRDAAAPYNPFKTAFAYHR